MTASELAVLIKGAYRSGKAYKARCPAHDDQNPSLGFGDARRGLWVRCHAGCSIEQIEAALGLSTGALLNGAPGPAGGRPQAKRVIAEYRYHDENGRLVCFKERLEDDRGSKTFKWWRPDGSGGRIDRLGNVQPVLYGLHELRGHETIFLLEGEKDCATLKTLGLPATTNPHGAGKWRDEYARQLVKVGVKVLVALRDNDRPGDNHRDDAIRSCRAVGLRVKRVDLPGLPPLRDDHGEDITDWFGMGHTLDEFLALVDATAVLAGDAVAEMSAAEASEDASPRLVIEQLSDVRAEEVDWIWPGRLARGKLTMLIGDPGSGKTFVTLDAAARLSSGNAWPDGTQAPCGGTILLSAEDGVGDTIKPRLAGLGADDTQIWLIKAVRENSERPFSLASDLALLEDAVIEKKPKLLVIDPISAYLGTTDSFRDAEVRALLAPLAALAEKHGIAVVAVMHLTKNEDRRAIARANGSVAFVAAARIVLLVAKDQQDNDRRFLAGVKNNLGPTALTLAFKIAGQPPVTAWEKEPVQDVDGDSLLRSEASQGRDSQLGKAAEFLRQYLADGEKPADDVKEAAKSQGISERTLERASKRLKIDRVKSHEHRGRWYWMLPAAESKTAKSHHQHDSGADLAALATFGQSRVPAAESTPNGLKAANNSAPQGGLEEWAP
jgi:putative DNA primase/helicase